MCHCKHVGASCDFDGHVNKRFVLCSRLQQKLMHLRCNTHSFVKEANYVLLVTILRWWERWFKCDWSSNIPLTHGGGNVISV